MLNYWFTFISSSFHSSITHRLRTELEVGPRRTKWTSKLRSKISTASGMSYSNISLRWWIQRSNSKPVSSVLSIRLLLEMLMRYIHVPVVIRDRSRMLERGGCSLYGREMKMLASAPRPQSTCSSPAFTVPCLCARALVDVLLVIVFILNQTFIRNSFTINFKKLLFHYKLFLLLRKLTFWNYLSMSKQIFLLFALPSKINLLFECAFEGEVFWGGEIFWGGEVFWRWGGILRTPIFTNEFVCLTVVIVVF